MNTHQNRKKWVPLFVLAMFILLTLACGSTETPTLVATSEPQEQSVSQEQSTQAATSTPVLQQSYNVGDMVTINDYVLIVLGWENVPASDFANPDEGKKFIAVELLIVNNGQSPKSLSTLLQMSMKDDTGQKYDVDFTALMAIDGGSIDGELTTGEKVRGKVGFQVPDNAQGFQFVFDASIFGSGKVFVDLGAEPISVEPPASVTGEGSQLTFNIGELIEMGTTLLTVNEVTNPVGDQFNKPDVGNKFLVVDLTIENKGATSLALSTLLQMSLKDSSGRKYAVDFMASAASGGSSPDGEVSPGEKLRGQVGFQVPENADGLVFVFDADVWGAGKVFVAVP